MGNIIVNFCNICSEKYKEENLVLKSPIFSRLDLSNNIYQRDDNIYYNKKINNL